MSKPFNLALGLCNQSNDGRWMMDGGWHLIPDTRHGLVLNMTGFFPNMTGFILYITVELNMTWFALNIPRFVRNMTRCA